MSDTSTGAAVVDSVAVLDAALAELAETLAERSDLVSRIGAARVRLRRPSTVVCVVGEFKQGKSSLVNGLLGQTICPVDDDIATSAITLVRHGDPAQAVVRYRGDADPPAERIAIDDVPRYVTEAAARRDGAPGVERVDIAVPSSLLADGLALVDTPGMGGLGAGHAAATLSFLPFADGLVFTTDATSELTATEVAFLERARALCPNVMVVVTKTDISPSWRRIVELDRGHLAARSIDVPVVAVSSALRTAAFAHRDRALNERSGFPELIEVLASRIIEPARETAAERARTEALTMIDAALSALATEREALVDPAARERLAADARDASARLEALQSGGARWNTVLGDRISDLSTEVNHRFRGAVRETTRELDEQIETIKTAEDWDGLARVLQTSVAEAVTQAFVGVERGRGEIRGEIAELLSADDVVGPTRSDGGPTLDAHAFWRSRSMSDGSAVGGALKTGLTGLRGAQGGIMMLCISGQFLPAAAAVFVMSNPVLLGIGAAFGGMQLLDDRKRKLQQRRQTARTQMRQFADDIQFEMGNELTKALREVQRDLRDEFVELIGELRTTWTTAAKQAETALSAGTDGIERRLATIGGQRSRLTAVRSRLEALG
jgi:hypothetical protein